MLLVMQCVLVRAAARRESVAQWSQCWIIMSWIRWLCVQILAPGPLSNVLKPQVLSCVNEMYASKDKGMLYLNVNTIISHTNTSVLFYVAPKTFHFTVYFTNCTVNC